MKKINIDDSIKFIETVSDLNQFSYNFIESKLKSAEEILMAGPNDDEEDIILKQIISDLKVLLEKKKKHG